MKTERRNQLRQIMTVAWGLFREAGDTTEPRTFADALAGAWRFIKRLTATPCRLARQLRAGGHVLMADTIASPVRRFYGAMALVGGRGSVAYLASRIGG